METIAPCPLQRELLHDVWRHELFAVCGAPTPLFDAACIDFAFHTHVQNRETIVPCPLHQDLLQGRHDQDVRCVWSYTSVLSDRSGHINHEGPSIAKVYLVTSIATVHCGIRFRDKPDLNRQVRTHRREAVWLYSLRQGICEQITWIYTLQVTPDKDYNIIDAASDSNYRPSLTRMFNCTAAGERRHEWPPCGKRFQLKRSLHVHMRSHTGDEAFKCKNVASNL